MASLFRSAAPKLSTPQPTAAPPATTSDGSPAKGVFDRYLAPSPAGSPSSTPRPPTEKRETQAQKKVRGLVEKFELKAKSLGTTNGAGGIKSSSSSKSLSSEAAGSPSAEEPTVVKKEEDPSEVADDKDKSESAEPASAPAPTSSAVPSPKPHHKGASTPFNPLATTTSIPSPSAFPRPTSPLLPPPESDLPVITSLSSQHLEPPSEASPSILSPIGEMANPLAATMYDQIKSVAAVLSGTHEMTAEQAAPRPPRQPSPEPEDEPEPVAKVEVKKEEQDVEVPKPKEDDKSTLSTPTTSQSQESVGESTATAPSSFTSEAATPAAVEVKKEETEELIVKKEEDKEETVPVKKEDIDAEDVKPDVSAVKTEEDTTPQAPLQLTHRHTLFFSDTSPNKKASGSSSAAYEHGLQPLFTSGTVQEFCGSWKALRTHLKTTTNGDDGLSGLKQDSNFHFFLEGIAPMWEDPMNKLGGRLTISLPTNLLDTCFTTLVLLLVGSVVEIDALPTAESHGGICGAVASRRSRGDRIEIWLGGPEEPDKAWVDRVKGVLAKELGMDDILGGRYKKHFS